MKAKDDVVGTTFYTNSSSGAYSGEVSKESNAMPKAGFIAIDFEYYADAGLSAGGTIQFYEKDSSPTNNFVKLTSVKNTDHRYVHYISNRAYPAGTIVCLYIKNTNSNYAVWVKDVKVRVAETRIIPYVGGIPAEVVSLGSMGYIAIYGKIGKDYKGGIMLSTDNSATVGNVVLGNAEGYIRVYFNGEYIKIPYYRD